jgi:hypothetical protein
MSYVLKKKLRGLTPDNDGGYAPEFYSKFLLNFSNFVTKFSKSFVTDPHYITFRMSSSNDG